MGAHNIEFDIPDGPASKVREAFKRQQEEDRDNNGSMQGYSGDFQTVNDVKIHDKVFNDYNEAHEYCLDNAEKWEYVVAVKYKDFSHLTKKRENSVKFLQGELTSKKLLTLKDRLTKEEQAHKKLFDDITKGIKEAKSKTIGCKHCGSQVNRQFVRAGLSCPVCQHKDTLMSPTAKTRLETKTKRIKEIQNQIKEEESKLKQKNSNLAKLRWLIAGWGAS